MENPWVGRGAPPLTLVEDAPAVPPHFPTGKPAFDATVIAKLLARLVGTAQPINSSTGAGSMESIFAFLQSQGFGPPDPVTTLPFLAVDQPEEIGCQGLYVPALTSLVWSIIRHFEVLPVLRSSGELEAGAAHAMCGEAVKAWARELVGTATREAPGGALEIVDLTGSWVDGRAFTALHHAMVAGQASGRGGLPLDPAIDFDGQQDKKVDRTSVLLNQAWRGLSELGVPQLLDISIMSDGDGTGPAVKKQCVLLYLSLCHAVWAQRLGSAAAV